MEDIKEGEYVRLKSGRIGNVKSVDYFEDGSLMGINCKDIGHYILADFITKHSFNLIDLIEVRRLCEFRKNTRHNRKVYKNNRNNT